MTAARQTRHVRLGTRGSPLALWQARWVAQALHAQYPELTTEIVVIRTTGDKNRRDPLSQLGAQGLFVKEIEEALRGREIDLAVHSMKDMPTALPPGLHCGVVPCRGEVRDAFIGGHGRRLTEADGPWRVGTGSRRRRAQLLAMNDTLQVQDVRGNIETRLQKVQQGDVEGVILAAVGLIRLGLQHTMTEILPLEVMLPAPGQGALALETRQGHWIDELLAPLHDYQTASAVAAERAFLAHLGGGCMLPIAALGRCQAETLCLEGAVGSPDGRIMLRQEIRGSLQDAVQLGAELAERLCASGADTILQGLR